MTPEMSQYYRNMKFIVNVMLLCFVSSDGVVAFSDSNVNALDAVSDTLELSYLKISGPKPGLPT